MSMLFLIDRLFVSPFLVPKSRYFALHATANAIAVVAAFPDMRRALLDEPLNSFNGSSCSMVANSAICAIHLYHCVAFALRAEDIFHHLVFTSILCGLAVPFKQVGGVANNLGCFFLSGLPGGVDYVLLVLVAQGYMEKMTQKLWCTRINVWMRGPSMAIYGFLGFHAWYLQRDAELPFVILFIVTALHFYNGQFYSQQAVMSYATHKERLRAEREAKKE
eukprot:TRINITY_DN5176_c0_g1_i1.p1 TRINITY_DN5176_c0_g1~~TRINITY_DN5176_c0_g1_i1.p1  ORF type:complete len:220 (-),score=47.34 TRINITY_DN5176_c0_g1_i1:99-758(-)